VCPELLKVFSYKREFTFTTDRWNYPSRAAGNSAHFGLAESWMDACKRDGCRFLDLASLPPPHISDNFESS